MLFALIFISLLSITEFEETQARLYLETGMAYLDQGLLGQAEEQFLEAISIDENCHLAVLGLGELYLLRSSWTTSLEHFVDFTNLQPDDYRGYYGLARLYLQLDKPDSALMMADSAFLLSPTTPEIWLLSGRAALLLGDTLSAELWFTKGMDNDGLLSMESLVLLGSVYRTTGRGSLARELLLPAAESGYSPAWWELARLYLGWQDYMRAGDAISCYLILSPEGDFADSAHLVLDELGESGSYMP